MRKLIDTKPKEKPSMMDIFMVVPETGDMTIEQDVALTGLRALLKTELVEDATFVGSAAKQ